MLTRDDLFQKPNLPIIVAIIASVASFSYFLIPVFGIIAIAIAYGAWFTWAWLELFQGTNIARRILGGIVIGLLLVVAGLGYYFLKS